MRNKPLPGLYNTKKTKDPELKLERYKVEKQQGVYPITRINPEALSIGVGYKKGPFSVGGGYSKRLFGPGGGLGVGFELKF